MCLAYGQDSILFLFFVALGLRLLLGGQDFWAGFALSACAAKPHLALLLPVFLIARWKWKALLGGATGGAVSMLLSFAAEGKDWPYRLLNLARMPDFDPAANRMPNLRGLLSFLNGGIAAEVASGLVIVAAVWFISRRQPLPTAGAVALAGGLLLSHHAYFYDAMLLLPGLLVPYQAPHPEWMRKWAFFLFTPLPYLFLLTNVGILGQTAINGYTVALIAVTAWRGFPYAGTRGESREQAIT
jgi:Gpi18-like mannosyltransferase